MPQGYRLVVAADEIDARRFEHLLAHARELLTLGQPDRAMFTVNEALALWRGRPLGELVEWDDGRIEAARLEELRLDGEELYVDAALQSGRVRDVLAQASARVAEAPLRERRWTLLALAQYQAGRQTEALRTLYQARQMLRRELGLEPGPELVALEGAILRHDAALAVNVAPTASAECPYPGLVAFDVGDADVFFGREGEIADCVQRLASTGVVAVVGPSGCGKSSLVRAGVAPAFGRSGGPGGRDHRGRPARRRLVGRKAYPSSRCWWSTSASRRSLMACSTTWRRSGRASSPTANVHPWSLSCAPTASASSPSNPSSPVSSSVGSTSWRRWTRRRCARRSPRRRDEPA